MRGALAVVAALCALGLIALEPVSSPKPPEPLPELRIDPNTAPEAILTILPRAGASLVGKVVEARKAGPFRSLRDLERRVKGVGPRTIERWRPYLSLEDDSSTTQHLDW
ncbi:MAG TPA: helix-hairpin-helix domain-containing protein [Isosphaeraceae bacterium]|jgi:DNA uptake protein ComE-like DNA-binding protein|nr:helix-hairpin-helix domain-containing protein [Isosphaeraceae bacterium]